MHIPDSLRKLLFFGVMGTKGVLYLLGNVLSLSYIPSSQSNTKNVTEHVHALNPSPDTIQEPDRALSSRAVWSEV